jgi:quinol monooxygenase YgiN
MRPTTGRWAGRRQSFPVGTGHGGCVLISAVRHNTIDQGEYMSIAIIARLNVAAGKEQDFEKAMLALAADVRANEPGNKLYTLCKDKDGKYLVLELYDDAEALTAHGQSAHFKAAGKSFAGVMAGAPEIQRLEVIG